MGRDNAYSLYVFENVHDYERPLSGNNSDIKRAELTAEPDGGRFTKREIVHSVKVALAKWRILFA